MLRDTSARLVIVLPHALVASSWSVNRYIFCSRARLNPMCLLRKSTGSKSPSLLQLCPEEQIPLEVTAKIASHPIPGTSQLTILENRAKPLLDALALLAIHSRGGSLFHYPQLCGLLLCLPDLDCLLHGDAHLPNRPSTPPCSCRRSRRP